MKKIAFAYLATSFLLIHIAGISFAANENGGENVPYKVGPSDVLTITVYDNPDQRGSAELILQPDPVLSPVVANQEPDVQRRVSDLESDD